MCVCVSGVCGELYVCGRVSVWACCKSYSAILNKQKTETRQINKTKQASLRPKKVHYNLNVLIASHLMPRQHHYLTSKRETAGGPKRQVISRGREEDRRGKEAVETGWGCLSRGVD